MDIHEKKRILERVKQSEISPQEGLRLIHELKHVGDEKPNNQNTSQASAAESRHVMDIAVIGMAGRFPGARNLGEFWHRLANGEDCITEIPPDRWDVERFYSADAKVPNRTYCRWSGMVPDADCFDSLFFNISPKEAQLMDPQQRLFLEESWRAIEDAGYAPLALSDRRCGVFAGVMQGDYAEALRTETESPDAQFVAATGNCFLPARVAYFLNLTGPCMALDTACSSSLVAIHQACQAIVTGEIEIALAGGVSVIALPYHHITSAKSEMLARDGRCKSFDDAADGFVPSEGVGVVMLKSLRCALDDGDHIYGVIKGGRVNQDGRSNGISAPSANSQTRLLAEVYRTYGIDPKEITYVEAHGTGTKLGDPIEFTALTRAFRQFTEKSGYCAIGSVKSNIGHALAAAGVAGLIKVLLCMKHGRLVPSLHFRRANKHIDFENSPFYVNTTLLDWPNNGQPHLAALSSFGLSGTNCHLVLAEAPKSASPKRGVSLARHLLVLSARTESALARQLEDLRNWVEDGGDKHALADVAYTLATGRSHFTTRVAFTARNMDELQYKLRILASGEMPDNAWRGITKPDPADQKDKAPSIQSKLITADADIAKDVAGPNRLGQLYVKGAEIDWHILYTPSGAQRIPLPTYSFERERYWLAQPPLLQPMRVSGARHLHPLIHENVSTLHEQRFVTRFEGSESFLVDHLVNGEKVLPGVACLIMARVAGELASERGVYSMHDVVWMNPLIVNSGPVELTTSLFSDERRIGFEVMHLTDGKRIVIARGWIAQQDTAEPSGEMLDIAAIAARCGKTYEHGVLYHRFDNAGHAYGSSFKLIEQLDCGEDEALARLDAPKRKPEDQSPALFELPLLDATLQTVAGIIRQSDRQDRKKHLPYSLGELKWLGSLPKTGYAHAHLTSRNGETWFFDVTLADEQGCPALMCHDFAVTGTEEKPKQESATNDVLGLMRALYNGEVELEEITDRIVCDADYARATSKLSIEV